MKKLGRTLVAALLALDSILPFRVSAHGQWEKEDSSQTTAQVSNNVQSNIRESDGLMISQDIISLTGNTNLYSIFKDKGNYLTAENPIDGLNNIIGYIMNDMKKPINQRVYTAGRAQALLEQYETLLQQVTSSNEILPVSEMSKIVSGGEITPEEMSAINKSGYIMILDVGNGWSVPGLFYYLKQSNPTTQASQKQSALENKVQTSAVSVPPYQANVPSQSAAPQTNQIPQELAQQIQVPQSSTTGEALGPFSSSQKPSLQTTESSSLPPYLTEQKSSQPAVQSSQSLPPYLTEQKPAQAYSQTGEAQSPFGKVADRNASKENSLETIASQPAKPAEEKPSQSQTSQTSTYEPRTLGISAGVQSGLPYQIGGRLGLEIWETLGIGFDFGMRPDSTLSSVNQKLSDVPPVYFQGTEVKTSDIYGDIYVKGILPLVKNKSGRPIVSATASLLGGIENYTISDTASLVNLTDTSNPITINSNSSSHTETRYLLGGTGGFEVRPADGFGIYADIGYVASINNWQKSSDQFYAGAGVTIYLPNPKSNENK